MGFRKTSIKTWAKGEPLAFLQAHVGYEGNECLIWPFSRNPYGYGSFGHEGKLVYAHRWMCAVVHGPAPTKKHQAAHDCNNGHGGCIHPKHVLWKTPLQNTQDKIQNGTTNTGKGRRRNKLTPEQVAEIRTIKTVAEQFEAAKRYGVSDSTIRKILYGKSWQPTMKPWKNFADDEVRRIRALKGSAKVCDLAAEYQVSRNVIKHIWSGKDWAHIQ
jgi:hypothetical protein